MPSRTTEPEPGAITPQRLAAIIGRHSPLPNNQAWCRTCAMLLNECDARNLALDLIRSGATVVKL